MKNGRKRYRGKKRKKATGSSPKRFILYAAAGTAGILLSAYIAGAVYFSSHFFFNTKINGYDCSGKSEQQAKSDLNNYLAEYELEIHGKAGENAIIKGSEIQLEYDQNADIGDHIKHQSYFLWPLSFFYDGEDIRLKTKFDTMKLSEAIDSLEFLQEETVESKSAYPKYDGNQFVIEPEVYGNAVDKEVLEQKAGKLIADLEPVLDLEKEECYAMPDYVRDSEEVVAAADLMNKYCNTSITYSMDEEVVIDRSTISQWISADESMQVTINEDAVREWLKKFGEKYDTLGKTRSFVTPTGKQATVAGGTYGWMIDEAAELTYLLDAIKTGEALIREPAYCDGATAATYSIPDWGTTYIEVDLTEQHMWLVKDGQVYMETDVVTGEPIPSKITPEGVYEILDKKLDEVLVGEIVPSTGQPEYRTPVDYWMRVTWSGIGFHDAIWQSAFGGELYKIPGTGSHGCINMPLDKAATLYEQIEVGYPVIIHY